MNLWMLILLSFLFVFSKTGLACDFKKEVHAVFSLSGPVTTALKEYGLFYHPKFQGISYFYPVTEKKFKGAILPGGVFLSPSILPVFAGSIVFFDDSEELKKSLSRVEKVTLKEITTRNLVPMEVSEMVTKELESFVVGCEIEQKNFLTKTLELQKKIASRIKTPLEVVFYLGEHRAVSRPPELIMANDGVVKWLKSQKKIKTYPSDLAYVNWSAKIMQQMSEKTLKVGIKDSGQDDVKGLNKISPSDMTLIYPGALTPGIDQLQAILYWLENL